MKTFGWRALSVALIIVFSDSLVKAFTPDNEESRRELNPDARSAYFSQNDFSYLNINPIGTSLVVQSIQCALTCLQHLSCFSFNLAAFPDDNGKLLCEHLLSDKYNYSEKFVASNTYHHFSIWSPCFSAPCKNNGQCLPLYKQNSYLCVCNKQFTGEHCENRRASKSCKDIWDMGASNGNGEYRIDPANDGKHLKVFCDMTTDGGGWLLVSRLHAMKNSVPQPPLPWVTSYRGIENQTLLTQTAMKELRRLINFTQLRFHCKKQNPGRTIHIATVKDSSGEAVVQYFSGQTDDLPDACHSFYKMSDDDSYLANKCQEWGTDNRKEKANKWGHEMDNTFGSDQNETRLFNHAMFVFSDVHWVLDYKNRYECDDYNKDGTTDFSGGLWEIFVR